MEEATLHQTGLAPEVRRFVERAGAGENVTADGAWFSGEGAEAETARPYNITDLLNMRLLVRKTAEAFEPGDINARALRKLLDSVDDTIEQLVEASGDETAILAHRKLRESYREGQRALDNPVIQAAREGRLRDVDRAVMDPQSGPESIRALKQVCGAQWWDDFGHNSLSRLIAEFTGLDGTIDHKGAMNRLISIGSDARYEIYGSRGETLMGKLSNMASAELERERNRQNKAVETDRDERLRQIKAAAINGTTDLKPTIATTGIGGWLLLLIVDWHCSTGDRRIGCRVFFVGSV
jgi:hypothetical protein